jgi:hypothetical protein
MIFPGLATEHINEKEGYLFHLLQSLTWGSRYYCLNGIYSSLLTIQYHQVRFYLSATAVLPSSQHHNNSKITEAMIPAIVRYTPELNSFVPGLNIQKADTDIKSIAMPNSVVK